jgi:hypothetical protein
LRSPVCASAWGVTRVRAMPRYWTPEQAKEAVGL